MKENVVLLKEGFIFSLLIITSNEVQTPFCCSWINTSAEKAKNPANGSFSFLPFFTWNKIG